MAEKKLFNVLKLKWKQFHCKHLHSELLRWHPLHESGWEEPCVEIEYHCHDCQKVGYIYLQGQKAEEWKKDMVKYKMWGKENG